MTIHPNSLVDSDGKHTFLNHKTSMTTQTPPHKITLANYFPLKDLKDFEDDLFDMIKNSKFNSSNQKTN